MMNAKPNDSPKVCVTMVYSLQKHCVGHCELPELYWFVNSHLKTGLEPNPETSCRTHKPQKWSMSNIVLSE